MEVTDELLAAYAEGKVSDAERKAVRRFLMDNPSELESVMMMMDKDFELELNDVLLAENEKKLGNADEPISNINYSSISHAPNVFAKSVGFSKTVMPINSSVFKDRLNDLLDELDLNI